MKQHFRKLFFYFIAVFVALLGSLYFTSAHVIFSALAVVNTFLFLCFLFLYARWKKNNKEEHKKMFKWCSKMFVATLALEAIFAVINFFTGDNPFNEAKTYYLGTDSISAKEIVVSDTLEKSVNQSYMFDSSRNEYTKIMTELSQQIEKLNRAIIKETAEKTDINKIVVTYNFEDIKDMQKIDMITVSEKKAGASQEKLREIAMQKLKKEAADIGAKKILVKIDRFSVDKENCLILTGEIYTDKQN
jgi:hypothetical protein